MAKQKNIANLMDASIATGRGKRVAYQMADAELRASLDSASDEVKAWLDLNEDGLPVSPSGIVDRKAAAIVINGLRGKRNDRGDVEMLRVFPHTGGGSFAVVCNRDPARTPGTWDTLSAPEDTDGNRDDG
jgi:hypothetical protein